ncbi:hypothetical protein Tco_0850606 [Tanacetum coccineum]
MVLEICCLRSGNGGVSLVVVVVRVVVTWSMFGRIGFECLLKINEQIVPRFNPEFYSQLHSRRSNCRNHYITSLRKEEDEKKREWKRENIRLGEKSVWRILTRSLFLHAMRSLILSLCHYLLTLSLVLRSLNLFLVCLYRHCHLAILCLDQHAHTLHHLESLPKISLDNLCRDNLDIFKEDLEYQSLRNSSLTLSSPEYGNQFLNDNADMSLNEVLKEPVEAEVQSMVDVLIHEENLAVRATPLVDTVISIIPEKKAPSPKEQPPKSQPKQSKTKIILKKSKKPDEKVDADVNSVQANEINKVNNQLPKYLPKAVSEYVRPRMESTVRDVLKKNPINLFSSSSTSADSLTEYELKHKHYDMMQKSRSFIAHEKHIELYNGLINLMDVDEVNAKDKKKRKRKDYEDKKKIKRKDSDTSSSKKGKDQAKSSKEAKSLSEASATEKAMGDEELIQDGAVDNEELVQDEAIDAEDMTHDDDAPNQDRSKWLKQDAVVRPEIPDPDWFKEPNANDAPEHNWFNEFVNAEKDPEEFDDLMAFTDHIDWVNPEGDRCLYDLSKPLPLQGPPSRTTIHVDFFFNKDLEYLKTGNKEKKYASSLTKPKAARYELEGLEEMIPKLWSLTKQKKYVFNEADFTRLHLNDIEDKLLLYVQNKLHHLKGDEQVDLINALHIFTQRTAIKKMVEDVQLGVESYQTKLNITMPQITSAGIKVKEPYTILYKPKGMVYLNKRNLKILMRDDELYKFSDGMLNSVHDTLNPMLHNFILGYNNEGMPNRVWSEKDQKRTASMLEKIDKTLLERRIMRSLESFVGGR